VAKEAAEAAAAASTPATTPATTAAVVVVAVGHRVSWSAVCDAVVGQPVGVWDVVLRGPVLERVEHLLSQGFQEGVAV
jgi:hypothetical protein